MSDDREFSNIYTIPPNYTDSGKLMGGMLETRNTVEAGILLVLVGYPEVKWLPVDLTTKIVIMTVTLIPLGVFALMGIGGDSLLPYDPVLASPTKTPLQKDWLSPWQIKTAAIKQARAEKASESRRASTCRTSFHSKAYEMASLKQQTAVI